MPKACSKGHAPLTWFRVFCMCVLLQLWQDHTTRGAIIKQHMHGQRQQSERCSIAAGGGSMPHGSRDHQHS
jgi:hypothetical protein